MGRLFWVPATENRCLSTEIKSVLQKRYGYGIRFTLGPSDIPYLEGLRDGGLEGGQFLLDVVDKYGEIDVYEAQ